MNRFLRKSMSLLLVLLVVVSLLPQITGTAAEYTYNWGHRGTVATELSKDAIAFYDKYNVSLESLSAYSGASSTSDVPKSTLYQQLKTLMTNAHSYKTSYDATKNLYKYTDCQDGGGKISSFYSGTLIGPGWGEGGSWNREHTWPNSKGLNGQDENDIMMLRPTATSENSSRGNTAYGESSNFYDPNDVSNGQYNLHGDVARIVLYVYVRWGNTSYMWGSSGVMESKNVLLKWMEEDPVDTWELGRNDAVQSITGTRNVFVDFPELAFELFNAEIPANMATPSGGSTSYTVTAKSSNLNYGTVSLSGNKITAYPYEGYTVTGYTVTSGKAVVSQSGDVFTVTPSSDCTVEIQFSQRTAAALTFKDRGSVVSVVSGYVGDSVTVPTYSGTVPNGYVFMGWSEQQVTDTQLKPTVLAEKSKITLSASKTYYAIYGKTEDGSSVAGSYQLVTSVSQLSEGSRMVIAASASTNLAMKSTGGSDNRYAGTIVKNGDNTISFAESDLIDIITLRAGVNTGTYSLYSETNEMYLAAGTGSSNQLILQNSVDSASSFEITVNSDGTVSVKSQTSGSKNLLRYNSSANIFSCYSSGQKAVSLYVMQGSGVTLYTTSPSACKHTNTATVPEVAPTCTEIGYTAGVYCNDCKLYISGRETVDALGHSYGAWVIIAAPTCTEVGTEEKTCTACGDVQTQPVSATGHNMDAGTVTTAPTCTEDGVKTFTCSKCGYIQTQKISATGHTMGAGVVNALPTCTEQGILTLTCAVCTETSTVTVAATGHNYVDSVCTACGDNYESVPITTLQYVFSDYEKGTQYGQGEVHTLDDVMMLTINGAHLNGEIRLYSGSNAVFSSTAVINSVVVKAGYNSSTLNVYGSEDGNTWTLVDAKAVVSASANYSIDMPKGSSYKYFKLESKGAQIRVYEMTVVIGSSSTSVQCEHANEAYYEIAPTCTEMGYTWILCADCGMELGLEDYVNATGHSYVWTVTKPATQQEKGEKTGVCSACSDEITQIIPQLTNPVAGWNVTLGEDITVGFRFEDGFSNVSASLNGENVGVYDGETNCLTVHVAAAQMMDAITISIDGEPLAKTYSVREYADYILSNNYSDETKNLVRYMLTYGGAAQNYFQYHNESTLDLADHGIVVTHYEIPKTSNIEIAGKVSGIRYYGVSLLHKDRLGIHIYFRGDITALTVDSDADTFTLGKTDDGRSYIEICGINPQDADKDILFSVSNNDESMLVSCSPMDYIVGSYNRQTASQELKALVFALYDYCKAAKNFTEQG